MEKPGSIPTLYNNTIIHILQICTKCNFYTCCREKETVYGCHHYKITTWITLKWMKSPPYANNPTAKNESIQLNIARSTQQAFNYRNTHRTSRIMRVKRPNGLGQSSFRAQTHREKERGRARVSPLFISDSRVFGRNSPRELELLARVLSSPRATLSALRLFLVFSAHTTTTASPVNNSKRPAWRAVKSGNKNLKYRALY